MPAARHPRVLFDEAHHNFHTAGGRYKPFADLITSDGYQVIPNREKFTRAVLDQGDILVIANALGAEGMGRPTRRTRRSPTPSATPSATGSRTAARLLLITDHAPFGAAAESLAKRFGVDMSKGAASTRRTRGRRHGLVFSRENHLLGDHPITRGRDDSERVDQRPDLHRPVAQGPRGERADPQARRHGGRPTRSTREGVSAAGRAQGLAFAFGKGRVVVMGEAAELSAQVFGQPSPVGDERPGIDNRQLALNIMHWLSRLID